VAALNHPNICHIYDVGPNYLVMEFVEGESPQGPLPLDEALRIARQICDALEAAHEKGIVHRDLKPANIKIKPDGTVKVLDFGLAKVDAGSAVAQSENSPTLSMAATRMGVILGTAGYMSPEQARGKVVDKRADIWAFGVVFYELLTGKRLFQGEDVSHTMAAVIMQEPNLDAVPVQVRKLLQRCLEKDPKKRLRDISGVELLLESGAEGPAQPVSLPHKKSVLPWVAAGAVGLVAVAAGFGWWRATRPVDRPLVRVSVDLGADAVPGESLTAAISPDGTRIVYPVRGAGGTQQLATRLLKQAAPTLLPGTEGAINPFFSPDGQWIGFGADGKLKKISVLGGAAVTISDAPALRGGSWGLDDNIIATLSGAAGTGLSRVPAAGGKPEPLTQPASKGQATHRWPQILPGGKAVLFTGHTSTTTFDNASIEVLTLKTGQIKVLQPGGYFGRYLADNGAGNGHLVYIHEGVLFGVPFDPDTLQVDGMPSPLLEDVAADAPTAGGQLDFSDTGTLVYRSGKSAASTYPVVTLDSSGKTEPLVPTPGNYFTPRFSPDGKRLALSITAGKGTDLHVYDPQREAMSHLTFNGQDNFNPVWTPDGKHIVFRTSSVSSGGNGGAIMWIRSDGAGDPQPLYQSKNVIWPSSFSPDGRRLAFSEQGPETNLDLWTLPLDLTDPEHPKPGKPEKFWASPQVDVFPMFSPDGHWIAYVSNDSGQAAIFVRPFPGPGGVWQISAGGGAYPFWSRDVKQLFYRSQSPGGRIFVVDYTAKGDTFTPGKPRMWSGTPTQTAGGNSFVPIDLAPDGKHFAIFPMPQVTDEKGSVHVTFLFNFFDELRRRMPAAK
jgi:serine/threonine-protein kinase